MSQIENHLRSIEEQIATAAEKAGRRPSEVRLVAVSKTHPVESIREAWEAGQTVFGESRVQESLAKIPLLPSSLEWQFIGHLQSNKIRKALPHFSLFHGVDTVDIARDMDRIAAELGLFPRVLLEVNVSGEGTKFGFVPDVLRRELEGLLALPRVQVEGLMTLAPYSENPDDARHVFAGLRLLRDELAAAAGIPLTELSMGMSGDFQAAIAEGSTMVRIGSSIFGQRPKPEKPAA